MSEFEIVDADKGVFKETKTESEDISIQDIRILIEREQERIDKRNAYLDTLKAKETAIMALPGFKEPVKEPVE